MSPLWLKVGLALLLVNLFSCKNNVSYVDLPGVKPLDNFEKALGSYAKGLLLFDDQPDKALEYLTYGVIENPFEPLIIDDYTKLVSKKILQNSSLNTEISESTLINNELIKTFSLALKKYPTASYLRLNLIKAHLTLNQFEEAQNILKDAEYQTEDKSLFLAKFYTLSATQDISLPNHLKSSLKNPYLCDLEVQYSAIQTFLDLNNPNYNQQLLEHTQKIIELLPSLSTNYDSQILLTLIDATLIGNNTTLGVRNQVIEQIDYRNLTSQWTLLANLLMKFESYHEAYLILKYRVHLNRQNDWLASFWLAICCSKLDLEKEYITYLEQALNARSTNPQILKLTILAHLSSEFGDPKRALQLIDQLPSDSLNTLKLQFYLQKKLNNFPEAFNLAEKIINWQDFGQKMVEINAKFASSIIPVYLKLNKDKLLMHHLEKIIALNSHNPSLLNNLAYNFAQENFNLSQAEKWLLSILTINDKNIYWLDTYAYILYKQKRYSEARNAIEKALELAGNPPYELFLHAAEIHHALDKPQQARQYWQKALALNPKLNNELKEKLNP